MPRVLPALAFTATLFSMTSAHADLIDPREDACSNKSEGDACKVDGGESGHCKKSSCSRLDYSDGTPPKTKSYDCFICEEGAAPTPTPDGAETPSADGDASKTDGAKDKPTGSPTPSEASANAEKKGCSVGASGTSLASFGLGLLLLGWVARRRYR